jgi:hypothetical protein
LFSQQKSGIGINYGAIPCKVQRIMNGFHFSVYRTGIRGDHPPTFETEQGYKLSTWQTLTDGLGWLTQLVANEKAIDLGGDGYPYRYAARKQAIHQQILSPPNRNKKWHSDPDDQLGSGWQEPTTIFPDVIEDCPPDEWLLIEVWDES